MSNENNAFVNGHRGTLNPPRNTFNVPRRSNYPFSGEEDESKFVSNTHPMTRFSTKMALCKRVEEFPTKTHLLANGYSYYEYSIMAPIDGRNVHIRDDYTNPTNRILRDLNDYIVSTLKEHVPDASFIHASNETTFVVTNDVAIAEIGIDGLRCGLELDLDLTSFNERLMALVPPRPIFIDVWVERDAMGGGIELGPSRVDISKSDNWAMDCFYPQLVNGIEDNVNAFMESSNNMWIFYGLPGTGKSTLSRQICRLTAGDKVDPYAPAPIDHTYGSSSGKRGRNVHVINSSFIIKTPNFITKFNQLPDDALVIIEDADVLMGKRNEGNDFMSALLNRLDGIVRSDIKLIFSCNLTTLKGVDEALLRPGRLFDATYFGKLSKEQTEVIQSELPAVKRTGEGFVLAELFEKPRKTGSVGFVD